MIRWLIRNLFGFRGMSRDEARDWAAILYTPILTLCAVGVTLIVWLGPWPAENATLQLTFLGWTLIVLLGLIGAGTFFLQRRTVDLKAQLPGGGSIELDNVPSPDRQPTTAEG